jgi:hypothetical protein
VFYMSFRVTEPDVDRRDVDGDFVAHGEIVELGGYRPVLFELVDAALHGMTLCLKKASAFDPVGNSMTIDWARSDLAIGHSDS